MRWLPIPALIWGLALGWLLCSTWPAKGQPLGEQLAHEDYPWVRAQKYVKADGYHCCSENHCRPAQEGELTPIPGGWRHNPTGTEIHSDKPGIYSTEDRAGRDFLCLIDNRLVCVFEGIGS